MLEEKAQKGEITEIREYHMENRVHFIVEIPNLEKLSDQQILKDFKLQTTISTTNFVLFTKQGKIARYQSEMDIMKEFFKEREELYHMRKEFLLA
jgi:DNA gyrase/topoisomerase IV subunit A